MSATPLPLLIVTIITYILLVVDQKNQLLQLWRFQDKISQRMDYQATTKVRASQYNHVTDTYHKKDLKERWTALLIDNKLLKIQRDLYSTYLIKNVENNLEKIDKKQCKDGFKNFKRMHDKEITRLKSGNIKLLSSMGL